MAGLDSVENEYRVNLISWIDIKKDSRVLLISNEPFLLADFICKFTDKLKVFTLVNKENKRTEYNCISERFLDIDEKFDYILVDGTLEYSKRIIDNTKESAYCDFLKNIKNLLGENGSVFIATDNRLGLKFFAGAPESYTENYFLGLRDYDDNNDIKTFSRKEIIDLLYDSGFNVFKFYYPYPDYRFPSEIFSENSIKNMGYGKPYKNMLIRRFELFNESKVAQALSEENVICHFANSFFIEIRLNENDLSDLEYIKYSTDRKDCFKISTSIRNNNEKKEVVKTAFNTEAKEHIASVLKNSKKEICDGICMLNARKLDDFSISYDFINSYNLDFAINNEIIENNADKIFDIIDDFFNKLDSSCQNCKFVNDDFKEVFGSLSIDSSETSCMNPANIDMIFDNIYYIDNNYLVIDGEWIFDFPVPTGFIKWRSINELYNKHLILRQIIDISKLYNRYNISQNEVDIYNEWNRHFTEIYVGGNNKSEFEADADIISLNDLRMTTEHGPRINSNLYYDCDGNGYAEEKKFYKTLSCKVGNIYQAEFDLSELSDIKELRFHPAKNRFSKCKIIKTEGIKELNPLNWLGSVDGFDTFENSEAGYNVVAEDESSEIKIVFELIFIENDVLNQHEILYNELKEKREYTKYLENRVIEQNNLLNEKEDQIGARNLQIEQLSKTLNDIYNSRSWKIITKLGSVTRWKKHKEKE